MQQGTPPDYTVKTLKYGGILLFKVTDGFLLIMVNSISECPVDSSSFVHRYIEFIAVSALPLRCFLMVTKYSVLK